MRHEEARRALPLLVSLLTLVVTSCSDDITGLGEEFDADAVARLVNDVSTVEGDNDAVAHIPIVSQVLRQSFEVGAAVAPRTPRGGLLPSPDGGPDLPGAGLFPRRLQAPIAGVRYSHAGATSTAIVPASHHGKTFVLQGMDGWMIDEGRSDAPAEGVRFMMYELDPYTRRPKLTPPQQSGYMDLAEEAGSSAPRLRVHARRTSGGSETLLDFYLEGYAILTEGGAESVFSSEGSLLARERVDYWLEDSIIFSNGFQEADIYFARDLEIPAEGRSVELVMDGELRASEVDPGFVQVTMTVTDRTATAVLNMFDNGFTVDGSITYNGQTVVLIGGDPFDPIFTNPAGTALSEVEDQAVWNMFNGADLLLIFGDEMLAPLSLLFP